MNIKGFNLFTALVAIILILLTGLLINTMLQTESSTKNTLQNIADEEKINAVSETVRENITQLVNFRIRWVINSYFSTNNSVTFEINDAIEFDKMKEKFIASYFSEDFANEFANSVEAYITNLSYDLGDYKVYEEGFNDQKEAEALRKLMLYSMFKDGLTAIPPAIPRKDFLQPVGNCSFSIENCSGTFYITLKSGSVPAEIYEDLPKVTIEESKTKAGIKVKNPILPRHDVKIFVPLRIFKILKIAEKYAEEMLAKRPEFQKYALGVCDVGKCGARDSINTPAGESFNTLCPGDSRSNYEGAQIEDSAKYNQGKGITIKAGTSITYQLGEAPNLVNAVEPEEAFSQATKEKITEALNTVVMPFKTLPNSGQIKEMDVAIDSEIQTQTLPFVTLMDDGYAVDKELSTKGVIDPGCTIIGTLTAIVQVSENNDSYKVIKGDAASQLNYQVKINDFDYDFSKLNLDPNNKWTCNSEVDYSPGAPPTVDSGSCSPFP